MSDNDPILRFFPFAHLPPHLREASEPFSILARHIVSSTPRNPERSEALRQLLESKDATVRARIYRDQA